MNVDATQILAVMPDDGIGLHTSVYANNFGQSTLPAFINNSGVQILRYPGGSYSDIYQWSIHDSVPGGYTASAAHFGNFVRILDQSSSTGMITVNYGSSHQNTMGGQPKEAAAWVAYANAGVDLFGTANDVTIGVDAEGNNWRTAGYWSRLRSSTPSQYQQWASPLGLFNPQHNFLAIDRDDPVGIKYWEIGNEIGGNGYFGPQWEYDLHAPYFNGDTNSNVGRVSNPLLSPTAYANNSLEFVSAMKAIDPTIKIGVGLDLSPSSANQQILSVVANNIDFGILHWYPGGSSNANTNASQVLNASDNLPDDLDDLRNQIDAVVGSNDYELHMTEFGYFGAQLANGFDGVFAANTYATVLEEGVTSAHWLELSKNNFLGDGTPQPGSGYYGIQVLSRIAVAGSQWLGTTSSNGSVETHATLLADGSLGLLIANLASSSANDATVSVNVDGAALGQTGTQWLYGLNHLTPVETEISSGLGNDFTVTVPHRSILALVISPGQSGDFDGDGDVDGTDFLFWQRGESPSPFSPSDLLDWESNYGVQGSSAATSVPEPQSVSVALVAFFVLSYRHRSRIQKF